MKILFVTLTFVLAAATLPAQTLYFPSHSLEIAVPSDWTVMSAAQQEELIKRGTELASEDGRKLLANYKDRVGLILLTFKYPVGSRPDNASLTVVSEQNPYGRNFYPERALQKSRETLESQNIRVISGDYEKSSLAGQPCYLMKYQVEVSGRPLLIAIYIVPRDEQLLMFQLGYTDETQLAELQGILGSVRLE